MSASWGEATAIKRDSLALTVFVDQRRLSLAGGRAGAQAMRRVALVAVGLRVLISFCPALFYP